MNSALKTRTLALLRARSKGLFLKDIATSADVPLKWLEAFSANRITDPGVGKIERLYTYLSGGSLNV